MKQLLLLLLFLLPIALFADTVSFEFDNDIIIPNKLNTDKRHSDNDYSNGVRLEYLADHWGVAWGQSMYTPMNLRIEEDQIGDRQYAGWMYLEGSYRRNNLEFYALQLGFIGKNSLAEET